MKILEIQKPSCFPHLTEINVPKIMGPNCEVYFLKPVCGVCVPEYMCVFVYTHVVEKVDESMSWVFWLCGNVLSKLSVVSTLSTHWLINKTASTFHINPFYVLL